MRLRHVDERQTTGLAPAIRIATPVREGEDPSKDSLVEDARFDFHLLIHSDAEGFYVPVDFKEVLFDEEQQLAGGMLGSSGLRLATCEREDAAHERLLGVGVRRPIELILRG